MRYLNLGCGHHYSETPEWTNVDFVSTGNGVIAHNLLKGIPFPDQSFDLVYHSHVLEHFLRADGERLIAECHRVLVPSGVLRIAIPDLERIARSYLYWLDQAWENPDNSLAGANYDWMMIEMYDQAVRTKPGGEMLAYLSLQDLRNEEFVLERIGDEGAAIRRRILASRKMKENSHKGASMGITRRITKVVSRIFRRDNKYQRLGRFRLGGEIHQWMYDKYSLRTLLTKYGFDQFQIRDAFSSYVNDWQKFSLDGAGGITRKPDSLFVEAIKKR